MSTSTEHSDLLVALENLSARKVERFSLTLGVPKRIIDEARENYPHDVGRRKSEAMSWWLANKTASWDAVAKALETHGVDERNLARVIRSRYGGMEGQSMPIPDHDDNHLTNRSPESSKKESEESMLETKENICKLAEIPHKKSSLRIPNPVVQYSKLSPDERKDLQAQTEELKFEIHRKFLKVKAALINSLSERISATKLVLTLLNHCKVYASESMYNVSLLQEHKQALSEAKDTETVFLIISPYYSYYNYELLQTIADVHGSPKDKEMMRQYILDFSKYCKMVPCEEFYAYDDHCQKSSRRTKLMFKLDYDTTLLTVEDVKNIEYQISKILKIKPSVLILHSVQEGCTAITFLVPVFCTDTIRGLLASKERRIALQKEIKMISIQVDGNPVHEVTVLEVQHEAVAMQSPESDKMSQGPAAGGSNSLELYITPLEDANWLDDKIVLKVKESETIKSLKGKIQAQKGVDPDNQRLIFKGKVLEDEATLSSCSIQNGVTLYLGLKQKGAITIHVATLRGERITLHVNPYTSTGPEIKKEICDRLNLLPENYRILYAGKELEEERKLSEYNITSNDSTLNLLGKGSNEYEIYVSMQNNGELFALKVTNSDTIQNVKRKIESIKRLSIESQELIFAEKNLEDQYTLSYYKIDPGSILTLHDSCSRSWCTVS